eukprot:7445324-Lingulodinium_polyedra.AAC.1
MFKGERITSSVLLGFKKDLNEACMKMPGISKLPMKRDIQILYRGVSINMKVHCLSEQVDLAVAAGLKGVAAQAGLIPALYCEADL